MKSRFSQYLIKCVVFLMIFSVLSPALPIAFAEENSSASFVSVSEDTYSSSESAPYESSPPELDTVSSSTYEPSTALHIPSSDPATAFNLGLTATSATYDTYSSQSYYVEFKVQRTLTDARSSNYFKSNVTRASHNANSTTDIINTGILTVTNNTYTMEFTNNTTNKIEPVSVEQNGKTAAATAVDKGPQSRTVTFPVEQLDQPLFFTYSYGSLSARTEVIYLNSTTLRDSSLPPLITPVKGTENTSNYKVVKPGTDSLSQMDSYFTKPAAVITTAAGKRYVRLTVKQSNIVTGMQTNTGTQLEDVGVISENTTDHTRVVQFAADSLSAGNPIIDARVHIQMPSMNYDMWHSIQIKFTDADTWPVLIADGIYSLDFSTLREDADTPSAMDSYLEHPATLIAKDRKYTIQLKISKDSSSIKQFKTEQNGLLTDAAVISEDTASNTRIVSFPVDNINAVQNASIFVQVGSFYSATHNIRLQFQSSTLKEKNTEGSFEIADGEYDVPVTIYENGSEKKSVMHDYVNPTARLIANNGQYKVQMIVNQSDWIPSLQSKVNGSYKEVSTIAAQGQTRTVEFAVIDPSQKQDLYVHVVVPGLVIGGVQYDHWYTVQLQLNLSSLLPDTNVPTPQPEGIEVVPIRLANGNYEVDFKTLRAASDDLSEMNGYLIGPASVSVTAEGYKVSFNVKDSTTVTSLQMDQNGTWKNTDIVSENSSENTRRVSFTVPQLYNLHSSLVHISTRYAGGAYEMDHPIRLYFDADSVQMIAGTPDSIADGKYSASLTAYKYGTKEISVMDEYLGKPATVIKKSGKYYVQVLLKNSSWIKTFKVGGQEAEVVSTSGDTRTVQFPVTELPRKVKINTHVIVPGLAIGGIDYDHTYDVDLQVGSLTAYEAPILSTGITTLPLDFDKLAVGKYTLPFSIVLSGTSSGTSSPLDRFIAADQPVQLIVEKDSRYVSMVLNNGSDIKSLRIYEDGSYKDAEVLSTDEAANTKTVKFSLSDYTKNVPAQLVTTDSNRVSMASTTANSKTDEKVYDFEFKFDTASVKAGSDSADTSAERGTNNVADGEYTAAYRILKNGTDTDSVLTPYLDRTAKLTAQNGKVHATITITDSASIPVFMTDFEGKYTAAQIVNQSADGASRTVTFEVPDLSSKLSIFAHANIPAKYMNKEKMGGQIIFDRSTLQSLNGAEPSQAGSADHNSTSAQPAEIPSSSSDTNAPKTPAADSVQTYSIRVQAYKDQSNELSVMNDYIDSNAVLKEQNGQVYAEVTLKNSSWMPVLQVEQDGVLKDAEKVSSSDTAAVIRFKVDDLSGKINAYTHVVVPGLVIGGVPYDHWYTVQLKFDESTKKAQVNS